MIEHKVQLDVFQMSLVAVTVNKRSDYNRHEAVQDECHQLGSNGSRSSLLLVNQVVNK